MEWRGEDRNESLVEQANTTLDASEMRRERPKALLKMGIRPETHEMPTSRRR